jgi:hypothetical protein
MDPTLFLEELQPVLISIPIYSLVITSPFVFDNALIRQDNRPRMKRGQPSAVPPTCLAASNYIGYLIMGSPVDNEPHTISCTNLMPFQEDHLVKSGHH